MDCVHCGTEIIGYFVDQTATVCDRNHLNCLDCDLHNSMICKLCGHPKKYCQIKPYEVDSIELVIDSERQVRPSRRRRHYFSKTDTRDPLDDVIEEIVLGSEVNNVESEEVIEKHNSKKKLQRVQKKKSVIQSKFKIPQTQYKTEDGVIITVFDKSDETSSDDTDRESQFSLDPSTYSYCTSNSGESVKTDDNLSKVSESHAVMDESLSGLAEAYYRNVDHIVLGYEKDCHQKPIGASKFSDSSSDSENDESKYATPHAEIYHEDSSISQKIPLITVDTGPIRSKNSTKSPLSYADGLKLMVWHNYQNGDSSKYYLFVVTASENDKRMKCLLENLANRDEDYDE